MTNNESGQAKKGESAQPIVDLNRILVQKFNAARGGLRGLIRNNGGSVYDPDILNNTLRLFYESIYNPSSPEVNKAAGFCTFGNNSEVIKQTIQIPKPKEDGQEMPPDRFVEGLSWTLLHHTDYVQCLFPKAMATLGDVMDRGPVVLWTQGQVVEQLAKLKGGVAKLRGEKAETRQVSGQEVMVWGGSVDKLADVNRWAEHFKNIGIDTVVVVEDNLENMIRAIKTLKDQGLEVIPVWVRQGREGKKNPPEGVNPIDFNPIDTIEELPELLDRLTADETIGELPEMLDGATKKKKCGFLIDYDGVFSDDDKKIEIQAAAAAAWVLAKTGY